MCTRTRASVYYANIIFKRLSFPFILRAVRYHYEHSAHDRPSGSPLLYIILLLWEHCAKITRPRCSGLVGVAGRGVRCLSVFAAPLSRKIKLFRTAQVPDFILLLLSFQLAFSHSLGLHISIVAVTLFTVHIIIVMCPTVESLCGRMTRRTSHGGARRATVWSTQVIYLFVYIFHYLFFSHHCLRVWTAREARRIANVAGRRYRA